MRYLLDFNIISAFLDETSIHHNIIFDKISNLNDEDELYVSILTLFEFEYSFSCCSDFEKQLHIRSTIDKLNTKFNKLGVNENEAKIFGEIKYIIKNSTGTSRENMKKFNIDIMIASSAISNSCIVVSRDKMFKTVLEIHKELKFENWFVC